MKQRLLPTKLRRVVESPIMEEDDDGDFKGWLTLPKIVPPPKEVDRDASWHILLSDKTFSAHSDEHVSACLQLVLGLDMPTSHEKVKEARKYRHVMLAAESHKTQAFKKLQKLRSLGLQAQISLNHGLPGEGKPLMTNRGRSAQLQNLLKRSYTDCFFRATGGKKSTVNFIRVQMCPVKVTRLKRQDGLAHWRSAQSGFVEPVVLPEDPIDMVLKDDGQELEAPLKRKATKLRTIICKHQKELQAKAQKERTTADTIMKIAVAGARQAKEEKKEEPLPVVVTIDRGKDISAAKKDACILLRFFVLGYIGNEDASKEEKDDIFYESIGTKEQVGLFQQTWSKLDRDGSGRVDIGEFRVIVEKELRNRIAEMENELGIVTTTNVGSGRKHRQRGSKSKRTLLHASTQLSKEPNLSAESFLLDAAADVTRFAISFCDKVGNCLLGKKSSFAVEDMFRVVWPAAGAAEIRQMKVLCKEFLAEANKARVNTPPVLNKEDYDALSSVFDWFDSSGSNELSLHTMVTSGLIYEDQIEELMRRWDADRSGNLNKEEFLDMMCPFGFRPTLKSEMGSQPDGTRVDYDKLLGCWKLGDEHEDEECKDTNQAEELLS